MWPWNGDYRSAEAADRARRDPCTVAIDNGARPEQPIVGAMIDYQAVGGGAPLGFAYDDVPFV